MGTSNWQNIPFCVDALMKIEPRRVLDIGVGFGRWGVLIREFCEVWFSRVHSSNWQIDLQGIEAFEPNIEDYHHQFYSKIHVGDAAQVVETLPGRWDVVLFGDVLEHFEKDVAERLLRLCLERSDYVMVNIPIGEDWEQDAMYGNPYERHLSEWQAEDFRAFHLVREEEFQDFSGRPFGVFILSRSDPKDVAGKLFSEDSGPGKRGRGGHMDDAELRAEMARTERRVRELAFELDFLKRSRPVRKLLRRSGRLLRSQGRWKKAGIEVKALGTKSEASQGTEVAFLGARSEMLDCSVPWYFMKADENWVLRQHGRGSYSRALVTEKPGSVRLVLRGHEPRLFFQRGPRAGLVEVVRRDRRRVVDLYSSELSVLELYPKEDQTRSEPLALSEDPGLVSAEQALDSIQENGARAVAISVAGWLGVGSATRNLFPHALELPQELPDDEVDRWAGRLAASGVRHFVWSGVCPAHLAVVRRLRELDAGIRHDTLWHGNYLQTRENFAWRVFREMVGAAREGFVHKIGFVKKGMEQWFACLGLRSGLLLNHVPLVPEAASVPDEDGPHVGLWLSNEGYRKMPYAMLAAVSMLPDVKLRGAGFSPRALEFVDFLGLEATRIRGTRLPWEELQQEMRRCHLTLYVTLSECCPMLPLESLAQGVPCLTAPNSHLFEDDAFLRSRLVVPYPEHAEVIAEHARGALAERSEIVEAYRRWAPGYHERARASVESFLDD